MRNGATHGRRALAGAALGCALFGGLVGLAVPASAVSLDAGVGASQGQVADVKVTVPKVTLPPVKVPVKTPDVSTPSTPAVPTEKPTVPAPRPSVPAVDKPSVSVPAKPGVDVDVDVDPTTGVGITIGGPDRSRPPAPDAQGDEAPAPSAAGPATVSAATGTTVRGHRRHAERLVALESGVTGDGEGVTGSAETSGEVGTISDQLVSAARGIGPTNGSVLVTICVAWMAWTFMQRRRRLARERRRADENTSFLADVHSDLTDAPGLAGREPVAVR